MNSGVSGQCLYTIPFYIHMYMNNAMNSTCPNRRSHLKTVRWKNQYNQSSRKFTWSSRCLCNLLPWMTWLHASNWQRFRYVIKWLRVKPYLQLFPFDHECFILTLRPFRIPLVLAVKYVIPLLEIRNQLCLDR